MNVRIHNVEAVGILLVLGNVLFRDLEGFNAFLVCLLYDLVINVSKVLNVLYLISAVLKVSSENIERTDRSRVSYVDVVVNRWSTGIDIDNTVGKRLEFFFFSCHRVVEQHDNYSSLENVKYGKDL